MYDTIHATTLDECPKAKPVRPARQTAISAALQAIPPQASIINLDNPRKVRAVESHADSKSWVVGEHFEIFRAESRSARERAWRLAYEMYLSKGYEGLRRMPMRITLQDTLPDTQTFLAESRQPGVSPLGTLTLVFDSPLGLPMDQEGSDELDQLRAEGRRLCEVSKLALEDSQHRNGRPNALVLLNLFRMAYLEARRRDITDLVITVHPRHAGYYIRALRFKAMGKPREFRSVRGTTGVPLRLDLTTAEALYREIYGTEDTPGNLYRFFVNAEEPLILQWLEHAQKPMPADDFSYFFWECSDILSNLTDEQAAYLHSLYPTFDLDVLASLDSIPMEVPVVMKETA